MLRRIVLFSLVFIHSTSFSPAIDPMVLAEYLLLQTEESFQAFNKELKTESFGRSIAAWDAEKVAAYSMPCVAARLGISDKFFLLHIFYYLIFYPLVSYEERTRSIEWVSVDSLCERTVKALNRRVGAVAGLRTICETYLRRQESLQRGNLFDVKIPSLFGYNSRPTYKERVESLKVIIDRLCPSSGLATEARAGRRDGVLSPGGEDGATVCGSSRGHTPLTDAPKHARTFSGTGEERTGVVVGSAPSAGISGGLLEAHERESRAGSGLAGRKSLPPSGVK